jgi:hypothetical protein
MITDPNSILFKNILKANELHAINRIKACFANAGNSIIPFILRCQKQFQHFMNKFKHILVVSCLCIFFCYAIYSLTLEGFECYGIFKRLNGLSDDQKRHFLIGEPYAFAVTCGKIIPESSSILYLGTFTINQIKPDLLLNYYLYPRRLYWLNHVNPYPEPPPEINDLDHSLLSERNIEWIIFRYPPQYGSNRIVKISNGKPIASFGLD